ncbi:glycoside hydrolase family 3 protein [Microbacterium gorillae]|uniref:glycoside hydrolase family 3 protein n=1 Tax=Microbacterium gorillae TaxID=1231063 RepID=UPI000590BCA9|nr:glycoside hydrolase family 3 N-terminal domain-containing protein [Microbacterium gorillae]
MSADPQLTRLANSVLWPGFLGTTAPDWLLRALDEGLAGAVYFGQNVDTADPHGTAALSRSLREHAPHALIGADEEGGNVTRLEAIGGSSYPGAAQLGRLDDLDATVAVHAAIGRRARRGGITAVLGPDADVNTNPRNPIIGVRSFGSSAADVSRHVAAAVTGLHAGGALACAKHFPGHGDTVTDSHTGLPRVQLSRAVMERDHLPPFQAAIEAGVDAIMTAHVVFEEFGELPATVNPDALTWLRSLGFTGAIVTDALDMDAIRRTYGAGEGAVLSLAAGADLLCIGNPANWGARGEVDDEQDYLRVRDAVVAALAEGRLDPARVEEAAARVATLVGSVPEPQQDTADPDALAVVRPVIEVREGDSTHTTRPHLVIDARRGATGAVAARNEPFAPALNARRVVVGIDAPDAPSSAAAIAADAAHETVFVLADALSLHAGQRAVVEAVRAARPDAVVLDIGVPGEVAAPVIRTWGSNRPTALAVAQSWSAR